MDINSRFNEIAENIFGLDYQGYLRETNRSLLGLIINSEQRTFEKLFGDFPDDFFIEVNREFHDSMAGYRVDVGGNFPNLQINADVLLLNSEILKSEPKQIDSILIHELCHMIIDANWVGNIKLRNDKKDLYHGGKLYNKTDRENEGRTKHTRQFCDLLSAASRIASTNFQIYNDRWDVLNHAMRFDINGGFRKINLPNL